MAVKPSSSARPARLAGDPDMLAQLGELGELQCTPAEVAAILGASEDAVSRFFARCRKARIAYEGGKARGFASLRRAQLKLAQTNAAMAIILGKAYLGQADRREVVDSGAFDLEAAGWRVRNKVAAIVGATQPPSDREGD